MIVAEEYGQHLMMTLAMLGYQRWLPRKSASIAPPQQTQSVDTVAPEVLDIQPMTDLSTPVTDAAACYVDLAEGIYVSRTGVLVTASDCAVAWFVSPPWREGSGYQAWADAAEGQFMDHVLRRSGLPKAAKLLRRYADLAMNMAALPEASVAPQSLPLPEHVTHIYAFSGWAWHSLVGQVQADNPVTMDWQGRQVQVICVPHPYRCLVHPATKEQLWRILIRLTYEM